MWKSKTQTKTRLIKYQNYDINTSLEAAVDFYKIYKSNLCLYICLKIKV